NDTDFALKLLADGSDIVMHPAWRVTHHSPTAHRRPVRWFRLVSRNRIWLVRRHGRGWTRPVLAVLATLDVFRRGLLRPHAIHAAAAGMIEGWRRPAPPLPSNVPARSGVAWLLVRLMLGRSGS
ncbi:MAG: hypothetical protein KDA28_17725, partial [Phycisphaerales bacterium]|nr:hypothetical protein [Phycisphaerales bacterium]